MGKELNTSIRTVNMNSIKQKLQALKLDDVDMRNILNLTPKDIYACWTNNKNKVQSKESALKYEIETIAQNLNKVNDMSQRGVLENKVKENKLAIDLMEKGLENWRQNLYRNINGLVKHMLQNLLVDAKEKDIDYIVKSFGDLMGEERYFNQSFSSIINMVVNDYKNNGSKSKKDKHNKKYNHEKNKNYKNIVDAEEVQIIDNSKVTIDNRKNNLPYNNSRNNAIQQSSSNNSIWKKKQGTIGNNVKVSMFYGSFSFGSNSLKKSNGSLERILLEFLENMTNYLYGNIQEEISDLYKEIDKKQK